MKLIILLITFVLPLELFSQSVSLQITKMPLPMRTREIRDSTRNYIVIHNDGANLNSKVTHTVLRRRSLQYHYFVGRGGRIYEYVNPMFKASHAGNTNYLGMTRWNDFSIGICLQGTNDKHYSEAQYESLQDLLLYLYQRYPSARQYPLVYHSQIAYPAGRKHDPGQYFDISRIKIDSL